MLYSLIDWAYVLPCASRIPKAVRKSIRSAWILGLLELDSAGILRLLRRKWERVPSFLKPLRDHVLSVRTASVVGYRGQAWLELTQDRASVVDWPWIPRPWATPSRFLRGKAIDWMARTRKFAKPDLNRMSESKLEWRVYSEWGDNRVPRDYQPSDDPWDSTIYVGPPEYPRRIAQSLGRVGLSKQKSYETFLRHFHGFRESLPRHSGHFVGVSDLRTIESDRKTVRYSWYGGISKGVLRSWSGAVAIFVACNGDELLLHPTGKMGWMMHEESRIREAWRSFDELIVHYADYLEYRWPFDSYGPSDKAIQARKARASGFRLAP